MRKVTVIRKITPDRTEMHEEEVTWTREVVNTILFLISMAGIIVLLFILKGLVE